MTLHCRMSDVHKILVTGSTGFVGQRLCAVLAQSGVAVREAVRVTREASNTREMVTIGEIDELTDWRRAVEGVSVVIHLAGRAHVMREEQPDSLAVYRRVNVMGTVRLAQEAASAGVRRFVFVSTIKVNGEATTDLPFTEENIPAPTDAYSVSKHEAEVALRHIGRTTGMKIVVVRPPLVYGPGVKGNFPSLMRWVWRGLPLPFARCDNHRSFVGLTNLVDLLVKCAFHPAAAGETFFAADGEDLSTAELVRRVALAFGRPVRLLPVPESWLRVVAQLVGRAEMYERLCGSLQVDNGKARRVLGWSPPLSLDEELAHTVRWFLDSKR